ncbi:hypothetical protein Hte_006272 [Hypoxylon texense]
MQLKTPASHPVSRTIATEARKAVSSLSNVATQSFTAFYLKSKNLMRVSDATLSNVRVTCKYREEMLFAATRIPTPMHRNIDNIELPLRWDLSEASNTLLVYATNIMVATLFFFQLSERQSTEEIRMA